LRHWVIMVDRLAARSLRAPTASRRAATADAPDSPPDP
jgi:hypothetical protein